MLTQLKKVNNRTFTENGAETLKSSEDSVVDLFALGGAARTQSEDSLGQMITQALATDRDLALRCIAYLSDVRGGQGERRFFGVALRTLARHYPEETKRILPLVPFYGRWDLLFELVGTTLEDDALDVVVKEAKDAYGNNRTSLVFKWMPSAKTHGKAKPLAKVLWERIGIDERDYRHLLSKQRSNLRLVEKYMSADGWSMIDYEHVPSKAMLIYRQAFHNHDHDRFQAYIDAVTKGTKKIHAGVLYPHDIMHKVMMSRNIDASLEAQWKALPNYAGDKELNVLPLVDVSGSMNSSIDQVSGVRAIDVSIGLGIYLAERLKGEYRNHFISFSNTPELIEIKGDSLRMKFENMVNTHWGMSTNIEAAFKLILRTATQYRLPQSELPDTLLVISDMEFNSCANGTNYENAKRLFEQSGYKLPKIVFWNVNARNRQVPVEQDRSGTALVSGYSPACLKYIFTDAVMTPREVMLQTLNDLRYDAIINAFKGA